MPRIDAPGAPGLPEIVDYDEHMVELKWEPPIRDGGAPVTGESSSAVRSIVTYIIN